jgi:predicted RNase H-like HicB family nuclease
MAEPGLALEQWLTRVTQPIDLRGDTDLKKPAPAYAILYILQRDGRWQAAVLDIPGCVARGKDVGVAKVAANQKLKAALAKYASKQQTPPPPVTMCHDVRPNSPYQVIAQTTATASITQAVREYRNKQGSLPPAMSVCGYVNPEASEDAGEAS